ncbi:ankyrin repeat-containing domain protein [Aspergillus germanicus]
MSLESFPTEILQQVGKYASLPTLNALSRTNHRFHSIFDPLLYIHDAQRARSQPDSGGGAGSGAAAVCWAATHGLLRTLQKSLQGGAEVPARATPWMRCAPDDSDHTGRTVDSLAVTKRFVEPMRPAPAHPLCLAVQGGHTDVVEFLLDEKGCDDDMVDPEGYSLLELAVLHGHVQFVERLLRTGASQLLLRPLVNNGYPIQIAVKLGKMDMVRLLWQYGSFILWSRQTELKSAFACAITRRNMEAVHALLGFGVGVNIRFAQAPSKFITLLEMAVKMGDVEIVEVLLAAGACPLYLKNDNERIASLVMRDSSCMQKTTALAVAAEKEEEEEGGHMVRFLLAHGTHPDFDDLEYEEAHPLRGYADTRHFASPLARAVNAGYADLVRLLVESGADVNVAFEGVEESRSSRQRGSVLQLAMDLDHREIVSNLREHGAQEEVEGYASRVWRLTMEEAKAPNPREARRKRLRRHMGVNRCRNLIQVN